MDTIVRYEFQLAERLSRTAAAAFPELVVHDAGQGTTLYGPVRDQAELHGFIDRFEVMGFTVIDVHRLPD